MPRFYFPSLLILSSSIFLLAACDSDKGHGEMPPPAVGAIILQTQAVDVDEELPGRLESSRIAEVRARVSGIVEKRLFKEGADVKQGEALFQIDSAIYEAQFASAKAQQAKAKANVLEADYQAERYAELFKEQAVSEFEFIQVQAQQETAKAELAAAKAQLTIAERNVEYAKVKSPIKGRVGRAFVTEGALVNQTEATMLVKVQQVDPMYINLQQSSQSLLQRFQSSHAGHLTLKTGEAVEVTIYFENGSRYAHLGKLLFSDIDVDPTTGQLLLRAEVPNPDGFLLPGMFVRVHLKQATWPNAFLVPQQAVMRDEHGDKVFIVENESHMLTARDVKVERSVDGQWLVSEGLKAGEILMVDGFQKAHPGSKVNPIVKTAEMNVDAENPTQEKQ